MKLIGLTGGIATGKSTVSDIIRGQGLAVIDADVLAREVVAPGSFGLKALVEVFGPGVLSGAELNRAALREKIFADPTCRLVVERVTHPLIHWRAQQEFKAHRKAGDKVIFYDAALIFEKNLLPIFDAVIVVNAPEESQVSRLVSRDKISKEGARQIIESQWSMEKKVAGATFVIDNGGTQAETKRQVLDLLHAINR
jgi:dephospho-CoA kinase